MADFTVTPSAVDTSTAVAVDASASSDLEDDAADLEVRWDWQNDGTWDTGFSTTKTASSPTYAAVGFHTIALEVRDTAGASSYATRDVSVRPTGPAIFYVATAAELVTAINSLTGAGDTIVVTADIVFPPGSAVPAIDADVQIVGDGFAVDGSSLFMFSSCFTVTAGFASFTDLELDSCRYHGIAFVGASGGQVRNTYIHDAGGDAIRISDTPNVTVGPDNLLNNNGADGVFITGAASDDTTVRGNTITGNSYCGIHLAGNNERALLEGNQIWTHTWNDIRGDAAVHDVVVQHNTLTDSPYGVIIDAAGNTGWEVRNNIITTSTTAGVETSGATLTAFGYNLFSANLSDCSGCTVQSTDVLMDPLFVDPSPAAPDFTLQGLSPAIDAGVDLGVDVNGPAPGDYNGAAPDIGAHEAPANP
jgi:parallel beta-helix repeat protein